MPTVKVGDINMYYEVHGEGEPLVFIGGLGANTTLFSQHIPIFSKEYKCIVFDNRGAGQTDVPDIPYTIKMMADDLAGLIDAIGISSAHILGASLGGLIAQQFALNYPERVMSLILECTSCGGSHSVLTTDTEIIDARQHPKQLPPRERAMQTLRFTMSQEFIDKNQELITQMIEKSMEHPTTPQGQMRQFQATREFDTYERLTEIKAPTLVIQGDADRNIPVENARILASRIPGAELVILKGMGHLFIFEAFDESNRITLDFLKRHGQEKR